LLFCYFFSIIYFSQLNILLVKLFNLNANNVGTTLLVGIITSLISLVIPIFAKLLKKGPITLPIPYLKNNIGYFSKSDIKASFHFNEGGNYQLIHNGIILKGGNNFSSTILPFNRYGNLITAFANFQALTKGNTGKYWRYGIELINQENKSLCLFHVDSENLIVLYINSSMVFRFIGTTFLNNKLNNLKVMVSILNDITYFSFYLNANYIHQSKIENIQKIQICFRAWSDDKKDHKVKIDKINVALKD
jgi:hypothetical protein